jgi:hypothetical protein
MSKGMQLYPYPLKTPTFAVAGVDTVPLDVLPKTVQGRIAHLAGVSLDIQFTPTISGGASAEKYGINNIIEGLDFFDGAGLRFQGTLNVLRWREMLEAGRVLNPDPDLVPTATPVAFRRWLNMGPQGFAGSPSDFLLPNSALENGELRFRFASATTRIHANCSAIGSVSIRPVAWLAFLDNELRIPPAHEFVQYTAGSADYPIQGRSLYTHLALVKSLTTPGTAIAAGDYTAMQLDTGAGAVNTIQLPLLTGAFYSQMNGGHLAGLSGEPYFATDDNAKQIDPTTGVAVQAADAVVQPMIWSPAASRISKLVYLAESALRVKWIGGSQTAAGLLCGRIVAQSPAAAAALAARALKSLGLAEKALKVKTLSKDGYGGPRGEFMPFCVKTK